MRRAGGAAGAALVVALAAGAALAEIPERDRRSDVESLAPETRAMQQDDASNPGMLWVSDGQGLWEAKAGPRAVACASCHADAPTAMQGVAARYPAYDPASGGPISLEQRINRCRTEHQGAAALAYESHDLLALTAYVALQSRRLPVEPPDERLSRRREAGRALFQARQGQLNLSCAICHDDNWGRRLAGNPIPQGHPTGYPVYRLEWQALGSLQRRFRNCLSGMRAEVQPYGSPDYMDLEIYLKSRAAGLPIETPAVRP